MRRALAFLTPVGASRVPDPGALRWFPAVGAALGLVLGMGWWAAGRLWAPPLAAALVVGADIVLTGGLHFDGLVDSADGLLPPLADRDRRLEVMADPRAGAFGVMAAVVVVLLRWVSLYALRPSVLLLAGLWCASRTCMAWAVLSVPYARSHGLASAFLSSTAARAPAVGALRPALAAGLLAALCLATAGRGGGGLAAVLAAVAAAVVVVHLARRRLGGFTGDVLGAAGVMAETAGLVVAAGKW